MSPAGPDESDTCRDFVVPAILESGWAKEAIIEQYPVQAEVQGRYLPDQQNRKRRADYVLDVPFALSTNGTGWVLYNTVTGEQSVVDGVPTPEEAWALFSESRGLDETGREYLLADFNNTIRNADGNVRQLRFYQRVAIHRILAAFANGDRRVLAVMATGSGKTFTALQLAWKLTSYRRFQQKADPSLRNYRVLYLADRDFLVGDPMGDFHDVYPEGAVVRVKSRNTQLSPDVYFSTYQALDSRGDSGSDAQEQNVLLANYPNNFFDLVIVDECHRGSAREDSAWRSILDHFTGAVQLGLTATPVDRSDAKTYEYFRNPVYTYSLKDGIDDGYLAPYTIRRVVFNVDADGVEVVEGQVDVHGQGDEGWNVYDEGLRAAPESA